jgi:hypothetical protein
LGGFVGPQKFMQLTSLIYSKSLNPAYTALQSLHNINFEIITYITKQHELKKFKIDNISIKQREMRK